MAGYWYTLGLVFVLVVLNALLAGSEVALVSLRQEQLRVLEQRGGGRERLLVRLARDPNRFLATIQIGITLAGFLASATAAVSLARPLARPLGFLGAAAEPVAVAVVTLVLTFITLVLGELAPKRLAMQYAQRWALLAATPLHWLSVVSRPVVWLLGKATSLVVRAFGGDPAAGREELTLDELRHAVAGSPSLTPEQRAIVTGALELRRRTLREVQVPRGSVFTVAADLGARQALTALAASGHSRAPVVGGRDLDDVVGVVSLRELVGRDDESVAEVARSAQLLPGVALVGDALLRMQAEREPFALVVDERGSVTGIVTVEDLLEEIVGEIYDETDRDLARVRVEPDGTLTLPGTFAVHDLAELGVRLTDAPLGDYVTVAGLVLTELGRIPTTPGDVVHLSGWSFEVAGVRGRAVTSVRVRRRAPAHPA
ncbi:hemolysin family protein [Saccharomonospora marina]|nr:hemolysin family protein [Saccharomonospora marina]